MAYLSFQSIVTTGQIPLDYNITGLEFHQTAQGLTLLASSGVNGGLSSYLLTGSSPAQLTDTEIFSAGMSSTASGSISLLDMGGVTYALTGGSSPSQMDGFVISDSGNIGSTAVLSGIGTAQGGSTVMETLTLAAHDMLYMAELDGSGIKAYRLDGLAQYDAAASVTDTGFSYAQNVVALRQTEVAGNSFLLAASASEDGVSCYLVDPVTGALEVRGVMGAQNGLGISNPTDMEVVTAYGHSFAIVASAGSHSLSVLEITETGSLVTADHVIDTQNTRFGSVASLETFEVGGQVYVLAGGGDDGISLFTLLPDGRLLHLETLEDTIEMGLSNVAEIAAHQIGQQVQVFVTSQAEAGLTQFSFDVSQQGVQVLGADLSDTLTGTSGDDIVGGGAGNDVLYGYGGDDILLDGTGSDQLYGGAGRDIFVLTADGVLDRIMDFSVGQDRVDLSSFRMLYSLDQLTFTSTSYGAEVVFRDEVIEIHNQNGGPLTRTEIFGDEFTGPDRPLRVVMEETLGTSSSDSLNGSDYGEIIRGMAGSDVLRGHGGADWLYGHDGADTLWGGSGSDRIFGDNDRDWLYGGAGDDFLDGGNDNDVLYGELGADELHGGGGNDWLLGGDGSDTLLGGAGNDALRGNAGNDVLYGADGNDNLRGGSGVDWIFGDDGTDYIYGDAARDYLRGGSGADYLYGGSGDDNLRGGGHGDVMYGDSGRDVLYGEEGYDWLFGGDGADRLYGGIGDDHLRGGAANDLLYGDGGADDLRGGSGVDWLFGGYGNDTLYGHGGNDFLRGEAGDDRLYGGNGNDSLIGADGIDWLYGGNGHDTMIGGNGADWAFAGTGNDYLYGGTGADHLRGEAGSDRLYGEGGDDDLLGGDGADVLYGGDGLDVMYGNQGSDWLIGDNGNDRLYGGTENDYLRGGADNDLLYGEAGDDDLRGGSGNDRLMGGTGADRLIGNSGADTFVFVGNGGADTIGDYQVGVDHLHFDDALWGNTTRSNAQIMQFAEAQGNNVVFDFGNGNSVTLENISSLAGLDAMLSVF